MGEITARIEPVEAVAERAVAELYAAGSAARRAHMAGYTPSRMAYTGTPVPIARKLARDLAQQTAAWPAARFRALVARLVHGVSEKGPTLEGRQVGYELLARRKDVFERLKPAAIEALGRGNDNWASVDAFACTIAGPAWRRGQLDDARVARWARSRDRWWRRTALAATVPLNRRSESDAERTLTICRVLVSDHDDMVVKALSWALRSLSTGDRAAVTSFLSESEAALHKRVVREVKHKLATGYKQPRKKR